MGVHLSVYIQHASRILLLPSAVTQVISPGARVCNVHGVSLSERARLQVYSSVIPNLPGRSMFAWPKMIAASCLKIFWIFRQRQCQKLLHLCWRTLSTKCHKLDILHICLHYLNNILHRSSKKFDHIIIMMMKVHTSCLSERALTHPLVWSSIEGPWAERGRPCTSVDR